MAAGLPAKSLLTRHQPRVYPRVIIQSWLLEGETCQAWFI